MELNINSPVYFKDRYGIDDEVYKFCQRAYLFFIIKNIKTKETMNYDDYVFVKTVILKVDDALCKAYQVLKLDEGKNI